MEAPAVPEYEEQRLEALYKLEVLDTPADEGFDRLVRLVKSHFNTPIVSIALVDLDRIWFKSVEGLNLQQVPRSGSICAHTIMSDDILLVPDVLKDARFKNKPPEYDGKVIRFYAGVPLTIEGGFHVGCLNIMAWEPREFRFAEYEALKDFAMMVEQQFSHGRYEKNGRFLVSQTMRLNTLLETVADGILTIDDNGLIESLNTAAANIFGFDRYELEGTPFQDLMPDLGRGGWHGYIKLREKNQHRSPDGTSLEIQGRRKDGSFFPMGLRVREMSLDGKRLFTGIVRDITDEKTIQDEIERGRRILETTKENVPVGITVFDENACLSVVNSRFSNLLDLPEHLTELGTPVRDIIIYLAKRGDFGEMSDKQFENELQQILQFPYKQRHLQTKSSGRYIEISSRPMPGGGFVSIYSDLTMRLRYEERLERALKEANRANEAKTNFLSTISHEIRTPLNGVIGVSQMLADSELDQGQCEKVDAILRSGRTLLELINDVLDMNKIESGNIEFENILFDLHDVIKTIKTPFMLQAREKGISFNVMQDETVPKTIVSDPTRLRQILMNLLGNALKFTERGSIDLIVSASGAASANVQPVVFKVIDTGVGIPKNRQEQVFDSFSQADTSIGRQYGGTGLGLAIVKKLVEMQDGVIKLESDPGQGSCFEVTMPFSLPTEEEVREFESKKVQAEGAVSKSLKVLVAEDNDVNAMVTEAFLKKMNCQAVIAEDGLKALDRFSEETFDLILMDVHMPEMDGIETTRRIRAREDGKHIPIIGLTAEAFRDRHAIFKEAGMNEVLTKPFTEAALIRVITEYGPEVSILSSQKTSDALMSGGENNMQSTIEKTDTVMTAETSILSPASDLSVGSDVKLQEYVDQLGADVTLSLIAKTPETVEKEMGVLKAALDNADQQLVYRAAHTIAGVSGSMCAEKLALQASIIEKNTEDLSVVEGVFPEFSKTAADTIDWWHAVVVKLQA